MNLLATRIYTAHIHPDRPHASEEPVFVKEGFALFAFLFTAFWALYHQLWRFALLIIAVNSILFVLGQQQVLEPQALSAIQIGFNLLVGFHGNDAIRAQLARRGYILSDIVTGDSAVRAQLRYFDRVAAGMS